MTFNKANRDLDIRGAIYLTDGSEIDLTADDVFSYSINENNASSGFPLGTNAAATYSLTINNVGHQLNGEVFDGAHVIMEIGLKGDAGEYVYSPFGQWYADSLSRPEQSVNATVSGQDALGTKFSAAFADGENNYPCTLKDLFERVCELAGVPYRTSQFVNSDKTIESIPLWSEKTTLRQVIGHIAACAGGFVRIARDGLLEIISFGRTVTHSLNPDIYFTFTPKDGVPFRFNALQAKIGDSEEYTRFALEASEADNATNTIQIDSNPILTEEMAWVIVSALNGFEAIGSVVKWQGDPIVRCGDKITVIDMHGKEWTSIINQQQINFSGGLSETSSCNIPTLSKNTGQAYGSGASPINPDGTINISRIPGIGKLVENSDIFKETKTRLEEAENKLERAEQDLVESKEDINTISQAVNELTGEVESKVSRSDYDALSNRVTKNESSIQQNSEAIKLKASSETVDVLNGTVVGLQTIVNQQAEELSLKAEKEDIDTLNQRVSGAESKITLNSDEINSRVSREVTQLNSYIAEKADSVYVASIETSFRQSATNLEARVESNESGLTTLQTGVLVDATGVTIRQPNQTDNTMVLKAGSVTINAPGREALVISQEESYMPNLRVTQFVMGNLVTTVTGSGTNCRIVSQYVS